MATVGGHIFSVNLSPICCRDTTSSSDKQKRNPISKRQAVSTDKTSAARTVKTKTTSSTRSLVEKKKTSDQEEATATTAKSKTTSARSSYETIHQLQQAEESCCNNRKNLKDYFVEAKVMIRSDGGPPRWFSPLDCGSHASDSPRLLFLPGIDGLGLGLIRQHQRLGKIFEVWCLHIPVKNRTSFTGLVKLIETTIRSEHKSSPKRPIYLVGESLGACLALAVAARNPHIDLVLILANSATSFDQSALQSIIPLLELMPGQITLTMSAILSLMTGNPLKMAMANAVKGLSVQPTIQDLSQDLAAMPSYLPVLAEILPKETLLWKLELLKAASAYANARLDAVKAQALILSSGKDQLLPSREEGQRLSSVLPKCQLRSFDDHGHFLFLEDGVDLVTIIKGASYYRRGRILNDVSDFLPPTTTEFNKLNEENRWLSVLTSPVMLSTLEDGKIVRGLSGIPSEGPVLLVGYHNFLGLEVFSMIPQFLIERNIILRGLAHPIMFFDSKDGGLPELGPYDKFRIMGAVPVSAANFYKLMSSKSHVLLYPGGMREAMHRKGEEYKLFWPETSEFVRMAATFGATIIPFGAVGEDDITQILIDYDDQVKIPFMKSQIEAWTEKFVTVRTGSEGEVGNQPLHMVYYVPKVPGRYYYYFGKPIETKGRKQELRDKKKAQELYIEIKSEVENCIAYLKEKRESDPYRNIMTRLIYQATNGFGFASQVPTFEL